MKYKKCRKCDGTGKIVKEYEGRCSYFDGDMLGFNTTYIEKCPKCEGTGKIKK